ncbi:MAG: hypothetical protein K6L75_02570 [Cellvibrionaceae bacterium]
MEKIIKRLVLRLFPELSGDYHLPKLAKVHAISDPIKKESLSDEYRPFYAVDLIILLPNSEPDKSLPVYRAVPLPVSFAGAERGGFGFPEPGTIVQIAFAYGLPNKPLIQHVYSGGLLLPDLQAGELAWQDNQKVKQRLSVAADWLRETTGTIKDLSLKRIVKALENFEHYSTSKKITKGNDTEEIKGVKLIEVLGAIKILSGGSINLSAIDRLNLTSASNINQTAAEDLIETVGNDNKKDVVNNSEQNIGNDLTLNIGNILEAIAEAKALLKVKDGGTVWVGSESTNLLKIVENLAGVVSDLASTVSTHSHPNVSTPSQQAAIAAHGIQANALKTELSPIVE